MLVARAMTNRTVEDAREQRVIGRLLHRITELLLRRPRAVPGIALAVIVLFGAVATPKKGEAR
jgi:hypothetical protein